MHAIKAQEKVNKNIYGIITGRVLDSLENIPLEYATVTIYPAGLSKSISGATTNKSGNFSISEIPAGSYRVLVEFIGYHPLTFSDVLISKTNLKGDLKVVRMKRRQGALQTVIVTTQGKIIDNRIDKMVFNAERDLTSQTGVATDVLKKVPQVSVDVDGNVELAGSSSIRFLINGKPSSAFGSSIADVLQSIPANQIKSIEVITSPGAKYDAQGLGGIINIILKKNTAHGVNGNISITAGTRAENGSFNFNARKGLFGINAFVSGNKRLSAITPFTFDRASHDSSNRLSFLHQEGRSRFIRGGLQSGFGFDWSFNEKNSLTGSFAYNSFDNSGTGVVNQMQSTPSFSNIATIINSLRSTNNDFRFHNKNASLNYKKTFAKEEQELNVAINTSFGNNFNHTATFIYVEPKDSLYYATNSRNPGKERETELQVDYTQPFKKEVILGIGSKLNFRDINSSSQALTYQPSNKEFRTDTYLSNALNYHQKVYAFYTELTFPIFSWFDVKMGGRYERTEIDSYFSNAQHQASIPGYNTIVPSIFFFKKMGDNQTIKLSYTKRIERPDYRDLNPFINTSDPKNLNAGNPYLQPEIGNRYALGYNREINAVGNFMFNLFYRTSNHDIQPYIVYYPSLKVGDSTYTNVSVSTRENIGLEKDAGFSFFADLHFVSKLSLRTNFFLFKRNTINALDPGFNSSSVNYRMKINSAYQFSPTLAAEFFGNFNSARHEVQGTYPSFTSYSMAIRKQMWNKKGSIALTAINPFSEYVTQQSVLFGANFNSVRQRKIPFRSFGINFTWKFGKLEFKKAKEENSVNMNLPAE
ncbi:MAG: outer membrane beta-barrel family protein [Flavisolibacter sp.]